MSTRLLMRLTIGLIAGWSLAIGLVLVAFRGASSGVLGAGLNDAAGQRLVGMHLLLLVPVYVLLVMRFDHHRSLLWLPFAGQAVVVLSVGYSILAGDSSFLDGVLAVLVSGSLGGLYGFIWLTEQRSNARARYDASESAASGEPPAADEQ